MRTILAVVCLALASSVGQAAQRHFVASNGVANLLCSITAPCRQFAEAVAVVNPGGEVVVLDSAGYGALTVDRAVSIIAPPGVYAGISVFSPFNGNTIDAPGAKVVLRGLSVNGQGGAIGVWMFHGSELHVEHCVLSGMTTGVRPQAGSTTIVDTIIRDV